MRGWGRALARLFAVQGVWSFERMLGLGMGYAAEPLLEELRTADPARHTEATVRSAEFFNCNPNLAGLALGATVRAEYDGAPGAQIARLRAALCSPLGALGDQVFWAGLVPALSAGALVAVAFGAGWWAAVVLLVAYNAVRIWTARWALRTGLATGTAVGAAIGASWLQRSATRLGLAAGFAVGVAVPVTGTWLLDGIPLRGAVAAAAVAGAGLVASRRFGSTCTAVRFALTAIGLTLFFRLVTA
jgi:mannose/fructose/N-acetylgalactosamine-specific phosphotransferase system component IID